MKSAHRLPTIAAIVAFSAAFWGEGAIAQTLVFDDELFLVVASAAPDTPFVGGVTSVGGVPNTTLTIDQDTGDYGGTGMSDALVRFRDFSLSPLAIVRSASLNFYTTDTTNGPIGVYRMTTDWGATTTWNTLGGDGLTIGVETQAAAEDFVSNPAEQQLTSFDVTDAVAAWLAGAPNFGFGIRNESGDGWDVQTLDMEGRPAPFLVVDIEVPAPVKLQVDRASGFGRLVSVLDSVTVELTSYELRSEAGGLNAADWLVTNLDARGVDAPNPPAPGQSWDTVNAATDQLFEANLLGGTSVAPGQSLAIGRVAAPGAGLDASVQVTVVTANFLGGADAFNIFDNVQVELVDFDPSPGDYNGDGFVNAADYTVWRDGLGGPFSQGDYAIWANNYGAAHAPSTAVPEPIAALVASVAVAAVGRRGRAGL